MGKMMQELISIIVPIYNVEVYVTDCIQSIINQTYRNLEIILVDDGSTDQSSIICDDFAIKDTRIKVIHKENGGLADARNVGFQIAEGTIVSFVDGDDWIDSNFISVLYEALKNNNADIAIAGINDFYNEKSVRCSKTIFEIGTGEEGIRNTLLQTPFFRNSVWNKLYRKELLEGLLFPIGKYYEDVLYTIKVFNCAKRYVHTTETAYNYIVERKNSIMNKYVPGEHILDAVEQYEQRKTYFPKSVFQEFMFYNDRLELKQILLAWKNLYDNPQIVSKKRIKHEIYAYMRLLFERAGITRSVILCLISILMRISPKFLACIVKKKLKKNREQLFGRKKHDNY